ncbi:neprilysin-1-like [Dermacentor albipictus]|uniref:neprilysin-1-like n=1 Tax=Dermacentor albipictus TaxID=60249 RepID=UPI0031FBB87E
MEEQVDTNLEPYTDETGQRVGLITMVKMPSWTVTAVFGAFCALLLVVVAVYCGIHLMDAPATAEPQRQTLGCQSVACTQFATTLKKSLSRTVRPCDDFYGHVCGSWDAQRTDTVKMALLQRVVHAVNELNRKVEVATPAPQTAVQKAAMAFQACEDLVVKNHSSMDAVRHMLMEAGLFAPPVWTGPHDMVNASCSLETRWHMAPLITFKLDRNASLLALAPSMWAKKHFARRSRRLPQEADFDALHKFFASSYPGSRAGVGPQFSTEDMTSAQLLGLDNRITLELGGELLQPEEYEGRELYDHITVGSFVPGIYGQVWRLLLHACLNHTGPLVYTLYHAAFVRKVLSLPTRIGAPAAQQYLRWYVIETLAANYHGPWIVEMAGSKERALLHQQFKCHRMLLKYAGRAFVAPYVRNFFTEAVERDLRTLHRDLTDAYEYLLQALRPLVPAFSFGAYDERHGHDSQKNGTISVNRGPFEIVEKSSDAYLDDAYQNFSDMSADSFENWLRLKAGFSHSDRDKVTFPQVYSKRVEPMFYEFVESGDPNGVKDFRLLPDVIAVPFYHAEAPLVFKLGSLASLMSSALLSLVVDKGLVDRENVSWAGQAYNQSHPTSECARRVAQALEQGSEVTTRLLEVAALRHVLKARVRGEDAAAFLAGMPQLSGSQLKYAIWCYLQCGEVRGRHRCNAPLREHPSFANVFACPAAAPMRKAATCAATLLAERL